jgi:hypothetical protein
MAADKRFYKRFNFKSVPMEEYEVRDVSRRLVGPDLFISLRLNETPSGDLRQMSLQLIVGNNSPAPADFCLLSYYKDRHCQATCHRDADNSIEYGGMMIPVCSHREAWRGNLRLPIWETTRFNLETFSVSLRSDVDEVFFFWGATDVPKNGSIRAECQEQLRVRLERSC